MGDYRGTKKRTSLVQCLRQSRGERTKDVGIGKVGLCKEYRIEDKIKGRHIKTREPMYKRLQR